MLLNYKNWLHNRIEQLSIALNYKNIAIGDSEKTFENDKETECKKESENDDETISININKNYFLKKIFS